LGNLDTLDKEAQKELASAYNAAVRLKTGSGSVETLLEQINSITSSMSRVEKMIANNEIPTDQGEQMVSQMNQLLKASQDRLNLVASGGSTFPQGPGANTTEGGGPSANVGGLMGGGFAPSGAEAIAPMMRFAQNPVGETLRANAALGQGIYDTIQSFSNLAPQIKAAELFGYGTPNAQAGDRTTAVLSGQVRPEGALSTEAFNRLVEEQRRRGR
jgi:hypothetical protein